jgi:drug/metabolite transporter (DMT)-like permease
MSLGATFILIAAIARACMVVTCRKVLLESSINATSLTIVQLFTVALASLIWCLFHYSINDVISSVSQLQAIHWLSIIYLVLFCTLIAFFAQNYAVQSLSATQSTAILGTEPIFGILFAVLLLNEVLTAWQVLGAGLILIATYKIMKPEKPVKQQAMG